MTINITQPSNYIDLQICVRIIRKRSWNRGTECYRIKINVAMDVVMDVLGESDVLWGGKSVIRRESEVIVAISPHTLPPLSLSFFSLTRRYKLRTQVSKSKYLMQKYTVKSIKYNCINVDVCISLLQNNGDVRVLMGLRENWIEREWSVGMWLCGYWLVP